MSLILCSFRHVIANNAIRFKFLTRKSRLKILIHQEALSMVSSSQRLLKQPIHIQLRASYGNHPRLKSSRLISLPQAVTTYVFGPCQNPKTRNTVHHPLLSIVANQQIPPLLHLLSLVLWHFCQIPKLLSIQHHSLLSIGILSRQA